MDVLRFTSYEVVAFMALCFLSGASFVMAAGARRGLRRVGFGIGSVLLIVCAFILMAAVNPIVAGGG